MNNHRVVDAQPSLFKEHGAPEKPVARDYGGLITRFLESCQNPITKRSYESDLRDFFRGSPTAAELKAFLQLPEEEIKDRLLNYQKHLGARGSNGLSHSTINRRLSALRAFLKFASHQGLSSSDGRKIGQGLPLPAPSSDADSFHPQVLDQLMAAPGQADVRGLRDTALLDLLCCNALHRSELCALNVADFHSTERCLDIVRGLKEGEQNVIRLPLSKATADAIENYLARTNHGRHPEAPLFCSLDRNMIHRTDERLTVDGIYYLVKHYAKKIHGTMVEGEKIDTSALNSRQLRIAAIKRARGRVSKAGEWLSKAQEQFPHINPAILMKYRR